MGQGLSNGNGDPNKLRPEDRSVHDWYRFVLSYPPHLVRSYLDKFGVSGSSVVLDPFCGTGTTMVECKKRGIGSIGIEANPMACLAAKVKSDWAVDPEELEETAHEVAESAKRELEVSGVSDDPEPLYESVNPVVRLHSLAPDQRRLILTDSISALPEHKALVLLESIDRFAEQRVLPGLMVSFAKTLVHSASNLRFGPEVAVSQS